MASLENFALIVFREYARAVDVLQQVDAPTACSLLLKHGSALLKHSARDVLLLLCQFIKDYHTRSAVGIYGLLSFQSSGVARL